jgi:hypothetical protein
MPRPRFQFRLRTLLIVVALFGVLLSQWPLLEWAPPVYPPAYTDGKKIYKAAGPISEGYFYAPNRVWRWGGAELIVIGGWQLLAWMRRRRLKKSQPSEIGCTRS